MNSQSHSTKGKIGEGNYEAAKRFANKEQAFVKRHEAKIPVLAKAEADALDGLKGDGLRKPEAKPTYRASQDPSIKQGYPINLNHLA